MISWVPPAREKDIGLLIKAALQEAHTLDNTNEDPDAGKEVRQAAERVRAWLNEEKSKHWELQGR